jgi:septal ring factor EnvC (AmiA/AmiB activator)
MSDTVLEMATMDELAECQKELEETQEDLTEQLQENAALLQTVQTLEIRLQRAEAILVTGALAFKATQ